MNANFLQLGHNLYQYKNIQWILQLWYKTRIKIMIILVLRITVKTVFLLFGKKIAHLQSVSWSHRTNTLQKLKVFPSTFV